MTLLESYGTKYRTYPQGGERKNKNPSAFTLGSGFGGGPGQNRTADTRIFSPLPELSHAKQSLDIVTNLLELHWRDFGLEFCVAFTPV